VANPITGWNAHHIVAAGANNELVIESRRILYDFGVDINSAANGIWLPKVKGYSHYNLPDYDGTMLTVATHNGGHTKNYYEYVYIKLRDMRNDYSHLSLP
ncbi:AHH domain-containing protein, partial [Caldalkalibacillus salinus]|uniref:AHH domain-containing protein n=1 Tax=Caldalkalibacillus salinus TaxID=2803787 RepID=UPI0019205F3E